MAKWTMALLLGAAGCNWTKFADQAADAPVRSIGAPSGFESSDFGKSITPLSTGRGSAAAFVATSLNGTHVVLVKIDRDGGVKTVPVTASALSAAESSAITTVAEIPGPSPTSLLLGSPIVRDQDFGRVYQYTPADPTTAGIDDTLKTLLIPLLGTNDAGQGRGLAAGFLDGVETAADYVIGSDSEIAVVIDGNVNTTAVGTTTVGAAPQACDVLYDATQDSRYVVRRPLLAARLWADPRGATVQQLFAGAPRGTGMGTLSILNVVNGALNCLASVPGPRAEFGHALAAGDGDGDGVDDFLVVGSPGQQAFVYRGWPSLPPGVVPPALAITPTPAGIDFGYAVAALNVDGLPGDEVLVSDPRASVGGKTAAGHILVYKFDPASNAMVQIGEIADHSPDTDENFGYTVNVLNFCRDDAAVATGAACPPASLSRILLVGAANQVLVYFRVGDNIPTPAGQTVADVRAF
jgi:hypothetical protein